MLHLIDKQVYKIALSKKLKIHDVFLMSLLEQDIIKKEQLNETSQSELDDINNEEYKIEAIWDSEIFAKKLDSGILLGLFYIVLQKNYPEQENI